jgi:hypothetical protein
MSEQIIIGVPGIWQNQREVMQALASKNAGFILAGFTLMDTATQETAFVELHEPDPRLVDVFETCGYPWIDEQDLEQIAAHRSTLWVLSSDVSISQARRMMNAGSALLKAGGLAVKVETSGVAHSASRWNQFAESAELFPLYCAYVNLISGDQAIYSCGMHNFGLPDVSVCDEIGEEQATQLLNHFNCYQLEELPPLEEGHYFSLDEASPRYRLAYEACEEYERAHPFHNPFGRWQLLPL